MYAGVAGGALHPEALLTWPVDHDFGGGGGGGGPVFGVPSLRPSVTTMTSDRSSGGRISCRVQRASSARSWPVFLSRLRHSTLELCATQSGLGG